MTHSTSPVRTNGDGYQSVHDTEIFVGDWRAFAACSCGWHTDHPTYTHYSPIDIMGNRLFLQRLYSEEADWHERTMYGFKWRLKRAVREAWQEISTKYRLKND